MHIDIHYFGTYAMARAAGLQPEICQTIATAAQFVDVNDEEKSIESADGGRFNIIPTAHPLFNVKNTKFFARDHRIVWLPFHFLPGDEGDSLSERLVCRKNSAIAQKMIGHCMSLIEKPFGRHLVGIAAHVYADTFSHYGFSGVSSRRNKVGGDSIELQNSRRDTVDEDRFRYKYSATMDGLQNWRQEIWDRLQSRAVEGGTGALGHGAVMKYPDYPFLKWSFSYERSDGKPETSERDNPADYLEACERLHGLFCRIGQDFPDLKSNSCCEFDNIRETVTDILKIHETDREKRSAQWEAAAKDGSLFAESEEILPYQGNKWKKHLDRLVGAGDSRAIPNAPVFRFFQAAKTYRAYVLRDLLPAHGLVVDQARSPIATLALASGIRGTEIQPEIPYLPLFVSSTDAGHDIHESGLTAEFRTGDGSGSLPVTATSSRRSPAPRPRSRPRRPRSSPCRHARASAAAG